MSAPAGMSGQIARGAAWMVAMRWLMRGIGLINTIVLARLLSPDDFGVMAMSAVIVELLMMLADTSVDVALIRDRAPPREVYDSAWTLQAIFGIVVAGAVVAAAKPLAAYYHDVRVETVMYILALRPAIFGFENVGVVEFRKALDFAKEFRYWIFRRLSLFVFGLILALTLRNYLALAIAAPISAAVAVLFSFIMSSYRPRFRLSHAAFVWSASKWMILQNVAQTALDRGDEFIIGGVSAATGVGNYYIASQAAPMPTRELTWPVERALLPAYARLAESKDALAANVISVMGALAPICFSAGVGLAVVAPDFVLTVFGEQWRAAIPFFRWLAIFGIFAGLVRPFMPLFYTLKRERLYAGLCALQVAISAPVLVYAAWDVSLVAVAAARTMITIVFFAVFCSVAARLAAVRLSALLAVLWRPMISSAVMAMAVMGLHNHAIPWPALSLAHDVAIGGLSYVAVQALLWMAVGRPPGIERLALDLLARRIKRPAAAAPARGAAPPQYSETAAADPRS